MKPGYVTVAFEYSRPVGPRAVHGGVKLGFTPAKSFSFHSTATWPTSDDYTNVVEAAVREALAEKGIADNAACTLIAVNWHEVNSCQKGFELAARAATLAAFEV